MRVDLHTHTGYSYDAPPGTVEELAQEALRQGIGVLGITEHVELFRSEVLEPGDIDLRTVDYAGYQAEIESFRTGCIIPADIAACQRDILACREKYPQLTLLRGVELGQPHRNPVKAREFLAAHSFDYIIGSVHTAPGDMDYYFLKYDALEERPVLLSYLDDVEALVDFGGFDVLAHIDYPLRVMEQWKPHFADYMDRVEPILRKLIDKDIALECNTRTLYGWQKTAGPERCLLERYRALGGTRITVGSDAHSPDKVGNGIPETMERLAALGFETITVFEERRPRELPLKGI